jgi:heme-degrading monooxygenase HmoA
MYGTVARMRVKPGAESQLREQMKDYEALKIPGFVTTYVYQMDSDPNEYYMAVIFDSKDAYRANAESPEQDTRYREMLQSLQSPPEWHDGEIVAGQ